MATKRTTRQITPTPPESNWKDEAFLLETDPVQDEHQVVNAGKLTPAPKQETEDFLSKSGGTSTGAPELETLSEGEIRHLQEPFTGLSREKALAMARAFGG